MKAELEAFEANQTWDLVLCPHTVKPIESKWKYSIKLCFDGSLEHYEARLVAVDNRQEYEVDYDKTFAHDHCSPLIIACCFPFKVFRSNGCEERVLIWRPQGRHLYETSIRYVSSLS